MKYFLTLSTLILLISLSKSVKGQCAPSDDRIDCHPDLGASEEACVARGCVWCEAGNDAPSGTPFCYVPPSYGYSMVGEPEETELGYRVNLQRSSIGSSYFGNDFNDLVANFEFWDNTHLRVKIEPVGVQRYEVPIKLDVSPPATKPSSPLYSINFSNSPVFSFQIIRKSTGTVLFDTSAGGLTFSDQFIQLATKLPSGNVYGIGENEQPSFRHKFDAYRAYPLWARDQVPDGNANMYGVQPYYTVVENDGNTHSVMLLNSNAQEFVAMPSPGFVYRTIGGLIDLHFFLGPTPENTASQFTKVIGRAPIPPYWGLGFQLCRWGYNNLTNMKAAVDRTAQYGIPHDVQYGDIDIMDRELDFTVNPVNFAGLKEYVRELKTKGIKFVTILDPGISNEQPLGEYRPFDLGTQMDVWLKRPDGTPMVGKVWPGSVYFPDYSRNSTREWWITLIKEFKEILDFDGLWIDMNEPASWGVGDIEQGCVQDSINNPPYLPAIREGNLASQTICPDVVHDFGVHYDTHSLYGWSESEPTLAGVHEALGKRGAVLTRSTFLGVGKWAAHWLGDNFSRWSNLHASIIGMLSYNHYGVPYNGADICGFNEPAEAEMCQRWQQLGAFYTFSRNHNGLGNPDQDPGNWGEAHAVSTRTALLIRYKFLPYLYTLFYTHATTGSTVVRALWHEFPRDETALGVDSQFLWGRGFLVSPVLSQGATSVNAYFPDDRWFNYYDGTEMGVRGGWTELSAPLDFIPIHLRGGVVYPTQKPEINTELSRLNPYGLTIALDDNGEATGSLYIDDGDSIEPEKSGLYYYLRLSVADKMVFGTIVNSGYPVTSKTFSEIRLLGSEPVTRVLVNGVEHTDFTNEASGEVNIVNLAIPLENNFSLQWFN